MTMAVNNDDAVNATPAPVVEETAPVQEPRQSGNLLDSLKRFFREVMIELKKTNWPTRNEWMKSTVVVLITITIVAAYLFVVDQAAFRVMNFLLSVGK